MFPDYFYIVSILKHICHLLSQPTTMSMKNKDVALNKINMKSQRLFFPQERRDNTKNVK